MAAHPLLLHLHKLPAATPEESLAGVLETLWKTRKSGLSPLQKSHLQSLLNLPSPRELDPVLSCVRLIIRKVLKEKLSEEDVQRLLPTDLSNEFRKTLVALLLKYQNLWDEESARDQPLSQQIRLTFPGRVNAPPACAPSQVSDISSWPRENTKSIHGVHSGCPVPGYDDSNLLRTSIVPAFRNNGSSHDLATLPRLKSMSWTVESRNSVPGNRLSIITLKLQDYTESHLGEVEFKFQLSKDTLEAMLRSMAHINDQLSDSESLELEPNAKRQRQ